MSKQILELAIQKAIDGGWRPPTPHLDGFNAEFMAITVVDTAELYSVIFNHDFAKALWGEIIPSGIEGTGFYTPMDIAPGEHLIDWQYHLQQMVIADDPIKYLGENL